MWEKDVDLKDQSCCATKPSLYMGRNVVAMILRNKLGINPQDLFHKNLSETVPWNPRTGRIVKRKDGQKKSAGIDVNS